MVRQSVGLNCGDCGVSHSESNVSSCDKQFSVAVKKIALRDVQNENRIANPVTTSSFSKDKGQTVDAVSKVTGTKRPSPKDPVSPPHHQSPCNNSANAQLVYVRRKCEAETGKSAVCDSKSMNADCLNSRQLDHIEDLMQTKPQIKEPTVTGFPVKEPKVACFPAYASIPVASLKSGPGNPSVPLPGGNANVRFAPAELSYNHVLPAVPLLNTMKGMKNLHWEERFHQLQILLKKLDESRQDDYVQMLQSLSSVELSRHAVELEKRSIQLSLEEAKELQRVGVLNVMGKTMKNATSPGEPVK